MKNFLLSICLLSAAAAKAQDSVTMSQIIGTEKMFGLNFTQVKRDSMLPALDNQLKTYRDLHAVDFQNDMPFPLWYSPVIPGMTVPKNQMAFNFPIPVNVQLPKDKNQLAFYSIPQLASL